MDKPMYGIAFPHQKAQISAWCWGVCGHGQIGAIDIGETYVIVCNEPLCLHLDKQTDEPLCEVDGRPLFLRKLKEVGDA